MSDHDHPTNHAVRLTDGAFYADDPHPHFQWLRENAPVYWDETGQVWGITLYEDVYALSKDNKTWLNSGGIRPDQPRMPQMIDMDDPEHLIVIGDMLGVDPNDYSQLLEWSESMMLSTGTTSEETILRAGAAFEAYQRYQRLVIEERRRNPSDDLVSVLVHAEVDGQRLSVGGRTTRVSAGRAPPRPSRTRPVPGRGPRLAPLSCCARIE